MYMSAWRELEDMISYGRHTNKYFTGKEIKDIIKKCLEEETYKNRLRELEAFKETYICKYPLNDNGLYKLKWDKETMSILKCYKRKDV